MFFPLAGGENGQARQGQVQLVTQTELRMSSKGRGNQDPFLLPSLLHLLVVGWEF